ncbi:MAG: type 4a pilus biogenesis protein PilO [Patescibacteria group bacterium]|nr:type 4a pilus biogenesis protein PilO [Patescibacteria group bacterium]
MIKLLFFPIALIFSLVIVIWMVVPTYKEARKIGTVDLPNAQKELDIELEVTKNITNLRQEYEMKKDDLGILKSALPLDNDIKSLLVQLETMILESSLAYKSVNLVESKVTQVGTTAQQFTADGVKPQQSFSVPQPQPMQIELEVTGSYENIDKFIKQVEILDRLANVISLNISASTQQGGEAGTAIPLKASITIEVYKQDSIKPEDIKRALNTSRGSTDLDSTERAPQM